MGEDMEVSTKQRLIWLVGGAVLGFLLAHIWASLTPHHDSHSPLRPKRDWLGGGKPTPIVMEGGSIHGVVTKSFTGWTKETDRQVYSYKLPKNNTNDFITLAGFKNNPAPITGTGGWTITYTTVDGAFKPKAKTLMLCSDQNCSGAPGDSHSVYLTVITDNPVGRLNVHHSGIYIKELHFHDKICNQDDNDDHDGRCDNILSIEVKATTPATTTTYTCDDAYCDVGIGKPE